MLALLWASFYMQAVCRVETQIYILFRHVIWSQKCDRSGLDRCGGQHTGYNCF